MADGIELPFAGDYLEKREMANENMNDIKERVGALLRKAVDPAATPAEADAAMRLAQKLMEKYQVTEADLDKGGNEFREAGRTGRKHPKSGEWYLHPVERYCAAIVGRFCGVTPWITTDDGELKLVLFGFDADVELANWMLTAFVNQFEADWELYKMRDLGTKRLVTIREARLSFAHGFTQAINKRLEDWMFRDEAKSPEPGTTDGKALVVKKTSLVEQELRNRGMHFTRSSHRGQNGSHAGAAGAGYASGSRAETGRGVGQSAIMIGR